jgi:hypothetical protein
LKLEQSIQFSMEEEDNVMEVLEHALKYCTANAGEMRKRILTALVDSVKGYSVDDDDETRKAEIEAYVQAFSTTISNYALSVSGKKGVVRFDSRVLRSALGFWLESPAAYERLRENSLEVYPSQTTLYNLQRKLIPNEGRDPRVYGWFGDKRRTGGSSQYTKSSVMILFDEMSMTADICTNIKNNRTTGFTATDGYNTIHLATELKKLLSHSKKQEEANGPVVEMNASRKGKKHYKKGYLHYRSCSAAVLHQNLKFLRPAKMKWFSSLSKERRTRTMAKN